MITLRKLIFVGAALAAFYANRSHGGEIKWVRNANGSATVMLNGEIDRGDSERLAGILTRIASEDRYVNSIRLDSPGGSLVEGYNLAEIVRKSRSPVEVRSDAECASACFMIFAAARDKRVGDTASIGVHNASFRGQAADDGTMAMIRYLKELKLPVSIAGRLVTTGPEDVSWLTRTELRSMGAKPLDTFDPVDPQRPLAYKPADSAAPVVKPAVPAKPAVKHAELPVGARFAPVEDRRLGQTADSGDGGFDGRSSEFLRNHRHCIVLLGFCALGHGLIPCPQMLHSRVAYVYPMLLFGFFGSVSH